MDYTNIVADITFLLGSGIDLNNYKIADRTRNVNERQRLVWQMIFESYGGWQFSAGGIDPGEGVTGIYADQNLETGVGVYDLPTEALTVNWVEILLTGNVWRRLFPISYEEFKQMNGEQMFRANGVPSRYMVAGTQIRLLQPPNYSQTSSLRVHFDADVLADFVAEDTTATPSFASIFHRMLSIGAALDYALSHTMTDKVTYLTGLWVDYSKRLSDFYGKRWKDRYPQRFGSGPDLVEEFS